jgi:predicted TPR repeat methyltransferase
LSSTAAFKVPGTAAEAFAPVDDEEIPRIVACVDGPQAEARVSIWRAADAQFDLWLRGGAAPSVALRRLALGHWSAGNARLASVMLATSVAFDAERGETWLDLGLTLQAIGDAAQARRALQRSLKLDPRPARGWLALALAANQCRETELARTAFRAALDRDASLAEAEFGLGLIAFDERRYVDAVEGFGRALALGTKQILARVGLGQSLFFLGDFRGAARELRLALDEGVTEPELLKRCALAHYLDATGAGKLDQAERAYREIAGTHAEPPEKVAMAAFQILSGYGLYDAALALARARLDRSDADPVQRYLIDAVAGAKRDRAPEDYLIAHFDAFADHFDRQVVDVLGYRGPQRLIELIGPAAGWLERALDLGCGTGLAGPLLREGRKRIVGVDLSPGMLAKAAERGVYDELVEAEMIGYLRRTAERFDLVLAADALVYLGDLAPFFAAAARVTAAGALVAFNLESTEGQPYKLLPSGRFAHDLEALAEVAGPWFRLRTLQREILRSEGTDKVHGAFVVMERRGARLRAANRLDDAPSTLAA